MSVKTLQGITGAFFIILGLMGILPGVDEGIFSLNNRRLFIEVIFGIVELFCGFIMIYGLFSHIQKHTLHKASMVVLIFWLVRIILSVFIWGMPSVITADSGLNWLLLISVELIVASAIWLLAVTYKR
ncbi:MAG: hypothetical protein V1874_05895 [Spirochaetota bacterium]